MLDGILVQHLACIPGIPALCQQIPQGLIVHLDEGGLHGIHPASLLQLVGCLQDLHNRPRAYDLCLQFVDYIPPAT